MQLSSFATSQTRALTDNTFPNKSDEKSSVLTAGSILTAASTTVLTGCGGGEANDTVEITGVDVSQAGLSVKTGDISALELSDTEIVRFLLQADFSANDNAIKNVREMGTLDQWLDHQMAAPRSTKHVDWLIDSGYSAAITENTQLGGGIVNSTWRKFLLSPDGVRQKMVLAWTQFFVVSIFGLQFDWKNFAIGDYLDKIEALAFGNFRDLLEEITLHSAMGSYLNMKGNSKADPASGRVPDENFAREIMQLFSIGLHQMQQDGTLKLDAAGMPQPTYTNDDVKGLAACFTGWKSAPSINLPGFTDPRHRIATQHLQRMVLDDKLHSTEAKTFLRTTIPAGTKGRKSLDIALNILFNHSNTAPFVSKFLIQRFVTSNPSPAYVKRVSAVFANDGSAKRVRGNMAAVFKAILLDPEARFLHPESAPSYQTFGRLREPFVRLVQWARTFGVQSKSTPAWNYESTHSDNALGQFPMRAPSVFNFFRPGHVPSGNFATKGLVAPEFQLVSEPLVVTYINRMQGLIGGNSPAILPTYEATDTNGNITHNENTYAQSPSQLVARYNLLLTANQLSSATVKSIEDAIASMPSATSENLRRRVHAAILLVMCSPEYLIQK